MAAAPKVEDRGMGARMTAMFAQDGAIGTGLHLSPPFQLNLSTLCLTLVHLFSAQLSTLERELWSGHME